MVIIQCIFFIFICILAIWQNLLLIITSLDLNVSDVKMRLLLSVRVGNFLHASQSNFPFVWSYWIVTKHIHFYIIGWRFPLLVTFSSNTTSWDIPYQCFKTALNFFIFFFSFPWSSLSSPLILDDNPFVKIPLAKLGFIDCKAATL